MRKMRGKKGFFAIKVDLEKTYNHLNWNFILDILKETHMADPFIELIKRCITSASLNVLQNGCKVEDFVPSRGIHQGNHFSPYIFVLCMDKLSHLICDAVDESRWIPLRVGKNDPQYLN